MTEYKYMGWFMVVFVGVILVTIGVNGRHTSQVSSWLHGAFTAFAFVTGSCTSILCGYIGMKVAVYANARTAWQARHGYGPAFTTAFRAGSVMGFTLVSLGLLMLLALIALFRVFIPAAFLRSDREMSTALMYEAIAGYGLGGSAMALFGRVGGGIYTKAADVGADLVGKLEANLPEDDPRNPAVIADNVGDNVGDIAGMGADLFGSFAEASCAAMVLSSQSCELRVSWSAMSFPLIIMASGILVSMVSMMLILRFAPVRRATDVEKSLKRQLLLSTVLQTPLLIGLSFAFIPYSSFHLPDGQSVYASLDHHKKTWVYDCNMSSERSVPTGYVAVCATCGLWCGLAIGYVTEFYTSYAHSPVREVAEACRTGAATNVIYGLALGYKSTVLPVFALIALIYTSFSLCGTYGIALAALGILSTLCTALTIDAYGPISDNAGGHRRDGGSRRPRTRRH